MDDEMIEPVNEETQKGTGEGTGEKQAPKAPEFKKPLDKMTAIELREVALEIPGVAGVHAMKKEELLPLIKEYYGIEDDAPKDKKKKVQKVAASVHDLKAKLGQLREKKKTVQASQDRKQTDMLRRRINRLKKQTRKSAKG